MDAYFCVPENYTIEFAPDLQRFTYTGIETLRFSLEEPVSAISLDAVGLVISECRLLGSTIRTSYSTVDKYLHISFANPLAKGLHEIQITFAGKLTDGLTGWYKSKYSDEKSQKVKYIATTHFEPADARTVFPCVDHPAYKATFTIRLVIDKHLRAISNMPIVQEKVNEQKNIITFAETPKMSSYLLYLGVGEFGFYEEQYKHVTIRGITTPGKEIHTKFAVSWAKKCLEFFEDYFQQPYVLPKVDLLAIPDFGSGAMENWGAITFRENLLLYYEHESSIATKQNIAEVVAHELAHQWFGNLVTMKWWNDLWLNESFATFMAYTVVDEYYPDWHSWSDYITTMVFGGMDLDALHASHPIQVTVNTVDDINELFDEIAYDKGGSILRMLETYVGKTVFRNGLRAYIEKYKYKNSEGKDLWNAIEACAGNPISSVIASFITQQGFPVISLKRHQDELRIHQQQFYFSDKKNKTAWEIPLVMTSEKSTFKTVVTKQNVLIPLPHGTPETSYVAANKDYAGFYITKYDKQNLNALGENRSKLPYTDKLGLLHDLYMITRANQSPLEAFIQFIRQYFLTEMEPDVLLYAIGRLSLMYLLLPDKPIQELLIALSEHAISITGLTPQRMKTHNIIIYEIVHFTLYLCLIIKKCLRLLLKLLRKDL